MKLIPMYYTKILEVNLFAFASRLFHEDFSPINGGHCMVLNLFPAICIKAPHRALCHLWFQNSELYPCSMLYKIRSSGGSWSQMSTNSLCKIFSNRRKNAKLYRYKVTEKGPTLQGSTLLYCFNCPLTMLCMPCSPISYIRLLHMQLCHW